MSAVEISKIYGAGTRDASRFADGMVSLASNASWRAIECAIYNLPDRSDVKMAHKIPGVVMGHNPLRHYDQVSSLVNVPDKVEDGQYIRYLREYGSHRFVVDYYPRGLGMPHGTVTRQVVHSYPRRGRFSTLWTPDFSSYTDNQEVRMNHPHEPVEDIVALDRGMSDNDHRTRFLSHPTNENRSDHAYRQIALERYTGKRDNIMLVREIDGKPIAVAVGLKAAGHEKGSYELAVEVAGHHRGEHIASLSWIDMAEILARRGADQIVIEITNQNMGIRRVIEGLKKEKAERRTRWGQMKTEMDGSDWTYRVPVGPGKASSNLI